MKPERSGLDRTIDVLTRRLLECRTPNGYWEGRLASSALSTAVAVVALTQAKQAEDLIVQGSEWLIANQNGDGGWGDTVISASNLSTTLLCWSALSGRAHAAGAIRRAEEWLRAEAGDLDAANLKRKIIERYGKDRTFSVPILSVLALTGRLGTGTKIWRMVPQLPFELAACPHDWFRWLRLPVVSYALPALVAIGQSRHHHAATRNPVLAWIRNSLRERTLRIARDMQPASGGYLEAAPLTAFVAMNLISAGMGKDPIVANGIRFLVDSVRPDGSWPIDTDLATWVSTLAINAIPPDALSHGDREKLAGWLSAQQVSTEHPFTHAMPGGWAWTHRSGGVPDADDTAGALLALRRLEGTEKTDAAAAGIRWLLALQNTDGGIPTFCRGWGALPFDRSAPDLTAHALEAWGAWRDCLPADLAARVDAAAGRAISYLSRNQHADGSWNPLWFGNQHAPREENRTYGTARVLTGLSSPPFSRRAPAHAARRRGVRWLLGAQNGDGGWGGADGVPSSIEETGAALQALARSFSLDDSNQAAMTSAMRNAADWLMRTTGFGESTPASPIGLYFARLWYYEELYPLVFALRGLSEVRRTLC